MVKELRDTHKQDVWLQESEGYPERILLQSVVNLLMDTHMNRMALFIFGGLTILRKEEQYLAIASQQAFRITERCRKNIVHHPQEEIIMTRISVLNPASKECG